MKIKFLSAAALLPLLGPPCAQAQVDGAAIDQAVIAKLAAEYGVHSTVVAHVDLTERFATRSQWTFVVAKQPDEQSTTLSGGGDPEGAISVCFVKAAEPDCSDAFFRRKLQQRSMQLDVGQRAFFQLLAARIVDSSARRAAPLLEPQACTLHGANGSCGKSTLLYDYDRRADTFRCVFFGFTGSNNNQETRFIEEGPLRGRVVVATPGERAPFGCHIEVYKPDSTGLYRQVMHYTGRTRYGDGNTLPVVDSEMPEILHRAGLWKKGQPLPEPPKRPDGCSALVTRGGVAWCEARLEKSGLGTIRIGLPLDQFPISLQQPLERTAYGNSGGCFYVFPEKDTGFGMMIEDDRLTRIDVFKPGIKTDKGVSVGDPIDRIKAAYGAAAVQGRDFYDDKMPEFTVTSEDGRQAMRFSTDQHRVTAIVAGRASSVAYVEGCL